MRILNMLQNWILNTIQRCFNAIIVRRTIVKLLSMCSIWYSHGCHLFGTKTRLTHTQRHLNRSLMYISSTLSLNTLLIQCFVKIIRASRSIWWWLMQCRQKWLLLRLARFQPWNNCKIGVTTWGQTQTGFWKRCKWTHSGSTLQQQQLY